MMIPVIPPHLLVVILTVLVITCCPLLIRAAEEKLHDPKCQTFQCGNLSRIGLPFANITYPECGPLVVDGCDRPVQRVKLDQNSDIWYEIDTISQDNTIRVRDTVLDSSLRSRDCAATFRNLSLPPASSPVSLTIHPNITLFKCNRSRTSPAPSTDFNYTGCDGFDLYYSALTDSSSSSPPAVLPPSCSVVQLPVASEAAVNSSADDPFGFLVSRVSLEMHISLECQACYKDAGHCQTDRQGKFQCASRRFGKPNKLVLKLAVAFCAAFVGVVVVLLIYYSNRHAPFWKKNSPDVTRVEAILKAHGSLAPKRYTYSEVKKFTNCFTSKLGEGGYGKVYCGKLPDGHAVAVKFLNESKGDGEEFVNEVASISKTSHVNIVSLLGFCFEGAKRALIYEFMPNGSLERFIYNANAVSTDRQLGWEVLYQIALGIARGLEYLHRGCNTTIVHFDIKPHNILLDEEFCPKIADFGLAKLCLNRKEGILSMLGARGTPGYIAPEVFLRNFGGVSHKSDVYSYGMMVLEMVGGRKNIDAAVSHSSAIYFPHWVHGQLKERDEDLELHGIVNDEEREKARKMIIAGLWCIQTDPRNRPAMHGVLDMLQGSLDSLQIPPFPALFSLPRLPSADSSATHSSSKNHS